VLTSFPGDVTIDLLLQPRPPSKRGPIAFAVELKKEKKSGRWLVDSMLPERVLRAHGSGDGEEDRQGPQRREFEGQAESEVVIVPGVLLALIALVPLLVLLNTWRRNRAIAALPRGTRALGRSLSSMPSKIRVVIAKPGLDGHDRGAKIIARALRDAGMEVIYTGLHQTPEQIVETAVQEDADAVGISILSGAHMTLVPKILDGLRENGAEDVLVVVGGTIPTEDAAELKRQGVAEVFTPGAPTMEIVDFLRARVPA
jgi:methylmalonyl-CoA mutase C-terminal domain/subunit